MVKLIIDNKNCYIRNINPKLIRKLEKKCSYLVSGFMYSPQFKAHRWDGKEHLLNFVPKKGYRVPVGLTEDVINFCKKNKLEFDIKNNKKIHNDLIDTKWNENIVLRDYQNAAVEAICSGYDWQIGSGMLKLPIRSGKTKTSAGIIHKLKKKTLFIVPSQLLLYQTVESLNESLCTSVGIIGDGKWDVKDITVATIQTLSQHSGGRKKIKNRWVEEKPDELFLSISKTFDCIIWDEVHHATAETWKSVVLGFDAYHKIGLSATIELNNERELERGVIWLKACCGNIRYELSMGYMIKNGYLMRQNVEIIPIKKPVGYKEYKWCSSLIDTLICNNKYRNEIIVKKAIEYKNKGLKVLIVSSRLEQLSSLSEIFDEKNTTYAIVTGRNDMPSRLKKIDDFLTGRKDILLGTVFKEGVDIPEIEIVINAEGGRDIKTTVQRMRNMTPCKNKTTSILVEFADLTNKYLAKHSKERIDFYRSNKEFNVKIIKGYE